MAVPEEVEDDGAGELAISCNVASVMGIRKLGAWFQNST